MITMKRIFVILMISLVVIVSGCVANKSQPNTTNREGTISDTAIANNCFDTISKNQIPTKIGEFKNSSFIVMNNIDNGSGKIKVKYGYFSQYSAGDKKATTMIYYLDDASINSKDRENIITQLNSKNIRYNENKIGEISFIIYEFNDNIMSLGVKDNFVLNEEFSNMSMYDSIKFTEDYLNILCK